MPSRDLRGGDGVPGLLSRITSYPLVVNNPSPRRSPVLRVTDFRREKESMVRTPTTRSRERRTSGTLDTPGVSPTTPVYVIVRSLTRPISLVTLVTVGFWFRPPHPHTVVSSGSFVGQESLRSQNHPQRLWVTRWKNHSDTNHIKRSVRPVESPPCLSTRSLVG